MKRDAMRVVVEYNSINNTFVACGFWKMQVYCAGEGKTIEDAFKALQEIVLQIESGTRKPRYKEVQELHWE